MDGKVVRVMGKSPFSKHNKKPGLFRGSRSCSEHNCSAFQCTLLSSSDYPLFQHGLCQCCYLFLEHSPYILQYSPAHICTNMSLIMKITRQIGVYLFVATVHRLPQEMSAKAKVKTTYLFLCLSIHSFIYLKHDFILVLCFLFILFLYLLIKLTTTQLNYGCRWKLQLAGACDLFTLSAPTLPSQLHMHATDTQQIVTCMMARFVSIMLHKFLSKGEILGTFCFTFQNSSLSSSGL